MADRLKGMTEDRFLAALTALSHEYGIGIAGEPETFLLESEDYERFYCMDNSSRLILD